MSVSTHEIKTNARRESIITQRRIENYEYDLTREGILQSATERKRQKLQ